MSVKEEITFYFVPNLIEGKHRRLIVGCVK